MKQDEKNVNSAELISAVRAGEQTAFESLLQTYKPLLRAVVARHASGGLGAQDVEDLNQTAMVAFYRAIMSFDLEQKEVEFGLYAKICMSNALVSQLRFLRRHTAELPLSEEVSEGEMDDPARRVMEEEAAAILHARVRAVLSPFENRVWSLYMAGYRSGEIARRLGKSARSVENAVYRIRQKLRKTLGERT